MSANNQTLIKEHKGKWLVYENIQAESWDDQNKLKLKHANGIFDTFDEAMELAKHLDWDKDFGSTEYGIQIGKLCKDDAEVIIEE